MPERTNIKKVALFLSLLLVGFVLFKAFVLNSARSQSTARSQAIVAYHRAQLSLQAADAINILPSSQTETNSESTKNEGLPASEFISRLKTDKAGLLAAEAQQVLEAAIEEDKHNPAILIRKIILECELNESTDADLNQLGLNCIESKDKNVSVQTKTLLPIFQWLYGKNEGNVKEPLEEKLIPPADAVAKIEKNLGAGWFRERAELRFYKLSQQSEKYHQLLESIQDKTWGFLLKTMILVCGVVIFGLVGLIVVVWQLCFYKRQGPADSAQNPLRESIANVKYGWRTVFLVFYAWFCTQLVVGLLYTWLKKINVISLSAGGQNSLALAISIAFIYLLSNGPALIYIYLLALSPQKTPFLEGINWRLTSGFSGPLKVFGIGLLGWLAAIPLVVLSYLLSMKLFHGAGSSNPIIAIVMEAASTDNLANILLFYLTLGVLAPFVEESLFRGFLYPFLRSRYGSIFSNLASAGLFAVAHLDPGAVLPLFCLGSIFAYLFEITGSIVPGIIAHGLWNSGTFTLVLLLFGR